MKFIFSIFILIYSHCAYPLNLDSYVFSSSNEAKRFKSLVKEIRCVVCQYQTIDESNAALAIDLRAKVYQLIIAKKSNQEIKNYLTKRYGDFILLQPRLNLVTALLWCLPFLGILMIFLLPVVFSKFSI